MGFLDLNREARVSEFLLAAGKTQYRGDGHYELSYDNGLKEEVRELSEAMFNYVNNPSPKTRGELMKEWADAQIVLSNIAWYFDIPSDAAFNRVHQNNMTKVVDGKVILREDGKILKPEGYQKADMRGL